MTEDPVDSSEMAFRAAACQGDLSSRRSLLLGSQTMEGYSVIRTEVPVALIPVKPGPLFTRKIPAPQAFEA